MHLLAWSAAKSECHGLLERMAGHGYYVPTGLSCSGDFCYHHYVPTGLAESWGWISILRPYGT